MTLAPISRPSNGSAQSDAEATTHVDAREPRSDFAQRMYAPFKRLMDFVGATILFVLLAPVMLIVALCVRFSSPGPIIFTQRRLTDGGRVFWMYKFRTMYEDAESATGAVWAKKHDPRVTYVGRILRKTYLDELPQLVNVIRGEMSLIGPRPERPELVSKLSAELPSFHRRLEVRGGITGLAQTSNGYASSIETYRRKLAWDILYVKRRSLALDLQIALRTLLVLFKGGSAA